MLWCIQVANLTRRDRGINSNRAQRWWASIRLSFNKLRVGWLLPRRLGLVHWAGGWVDWCATHGLGIRCYRPRAVVVLAIRKSMELFSTNYGNLSVLHKLKLFGGKLYSSSCCHLGMSSSFPFHPSFIIRTKYSSMHQHHSLVSWPSPLNACEKGSGNMAYNELYEYKNCVLAVLHQVFSFKIWKLRTFALRKCSFVTSVTHYYSVDLQRVSSLLFEYDTIVCLFPFRDVRFALAISRTIVLPSLSHTLLK